MNLVSQYYAAFAAAYVRGQALRGAANPVEGTPKLLQALLNTPLEQLTETQTEGILLAGEAAGLKLYHFKSGSRELPRIKKVLGILRSFPFQTLLDVGSGRGVFLWRCLGELPEIKVTSVDLLAERVAFMQAVTLGGLERLKAVQADFCVYNGPPVDVVTLLEVLEHIPDVQAAVRTAVKLAQKYVVVSVPSKPDNNPEHIHLLTREKLTALFASAGCARLHFDGVNGHLLMIATMEAHT